MKKFLSLISIPFLTLLLAVSSSLIFHDFLVKQDNKYTTSMQPVSGILTINDDNLHQQVISLVDDWEFYEDVFLTSDDFVNHRVTGGHYQYIGQYPDFSMRDSQRSPFGYATYRLTLVNDGEPRLLSLMIPALYSSGRVFINNELVYTSGNPSIEHYQSLIKRKTLTFEFDKKSEIIIHVANYDHTYSGLYSPPLLGSPQAIQNRNYQHLLFYSFLVFTTLTIFVLCFVLWNKHKQLKIQFYLAICCLAYLVSISTNLFLLIGINWVPLYYAIVDTSLMVFISSVLALVHSIAKEGISWYKRGLRPLSYFMIGFVFIGHFLILSVPNFVNLYGSMIDCYKYLCALYLIFFIFKDSLNHKHQHFIIYLAVSCFAIALADTIIFSNEFEPVTFGWFFEYSSFVIVLLFMAYTIQINRQIYRDNQRLNQHLVEEVEERTAELTHLLNDRKQFVADIAHDLKAPLSTIQTYLDYVKESGGLSNPDFETYLSIINKKSAEATSQLVSLQKLNEDEANTEPRSSFCINDLINDLSNQFTLDMEANGIHFKVIICEERALMTGYPEHLNRAFSNIIYNAMSFTPVEGHIEIALTIDDEIQIVISDDGIGMSEDIIKNIFDRYYSTRLKEGNNQGLGLHISKEIIGGHNGRIHVDSKLNQGTIFTISFYK